MKGSVSMDENKTAGAEEKTVENTPKTKKGKKVKFYDITAENDIAYKGPLSYRYLKIIGWALLAVACLGTIFGLYSSYIDKSYELPSRILQYGKDLSVSLLLIGAFATVLNGRDDYKRVLLTNASIAMGLVLFSYFMYERYIVTLGGALIGTREGAREVVGLAFADESSQGFMSFNIFIDLTLCTLVMFFVNYQPNKYFQGKKIILFRLLVLIPFAYEIVSLVLKILASTHKISLSVYIFPFLTTKPPVSFLLFLSMARYFKKTEKKFLKNGKTHEDYQAYLETNHNSLRFSKYLSRKIVKYAVIDLILAIIMTIVYLLVSGLDPEAEGATEKAIEMVFAWGFGETVGMIIMIPVLLLFSYTKTHKNRLLDIAVPITGVAVIILIYMDGLFQFGCDFLRTAADKLTSSLG